MKLIQWIFDKIATSFVNKKTGDLLKDEKFAKSVKDSKDAQKRMRERLRKKYPDAGI